MRALCWHGVNDVRIENVPDPTIINQRDAIIKVTSTAICGSDLHLLDGFIPTMESGDILGHEFMGEVVEVGKGVSNLKVGDRVIVPFPIACGNCYFCKKELYSLCDNSNPNAHIAAAAYGHSPCGIFGYSHMLGGYAGGQAEYVRVPYADVGPFKVPGHLTDEQVLFMTDILPTGYMAAENGNIQPGDVVAVWGAGPVGQFSVASAKLLGAERVIVIDRFPERLRMAVENSGAIAVNYDEVSVSEALMELTGGRGPDVCIDAVGMEAHGGSVDAVVDKVKAAAFMTTDRIHSLREAIINCRKGGTVSVPGVYGGVPDKFPMGAIVNKGLTLRSGQTHVHRYLPRLLEHIEKGDIDPRFIITHMMPLDEAPTGYEMFKKKQDACVKVVLKP